MDMDNQNESLKIQKDILWGLYQEHRAHARHNETLRSTVINMLIVASAALVSIITYDKNIDLTDLGAAILLVGFGLLGLAFSTYYTAKIYKHKTRAQQYWKKFDEMFFDQPEKISLEGIHHEASRKYTEGLLSKLWNRGSLIDTVKTVSNSLVLWSILPILISLIGLYLTLSSIF
jgi:hypothetical protein